MSSSTPGAQDRRRHRLRERRGRGPGVATAPLVRWPPCPSPRPGVDGHGERAAHCHGWVKAGPEGEGFAVEAWLPVAGP